MCIYLFSSCCALLISVLCRKLWENFSNYLFKYYFSAITFFSLLYLLLEECWSLLVSLQSLTCLWYFFTILTLCVAFSMGPQAIFTFVHFPFVFIHWFLILENILFSFLWFLIFLCLILFYFWLFVSKFLGLLLWVLGFFNLSDDLRHLL